MTWRDDVRACGEAGRRRPCEGWRVWPSRLTSRRAAIVFWHPDASRILASPLIFFTSSPALRPTNPASPPTAGSPHAHTRRGRASRGYGRGCGLCGRHQHLSWYVVRLALAIVVEGAEWRDARVPAAVSRSRHGSTSPFRAGLVCVLMGVTRRRWLLRFSDASHSGCSASPFSPRPSSFARLARR